MEPGNTKMYKKQISKKYDSELLKRSDRIEMFANFMYPDLNDREIFYLAESAGFGKGDLLDLKEKLEERKKREEVAKENGIELRVQYLNEQMQKCETKEEKIEKIKFIYDSYMETEQIRKEVSLSKFNNILKKSEVEAETIDSFVQYEKENNEKSKIYKDMLKSVENQKVEQRKNIENMEQNIINNKDKER